MPTTVTACRVLRSMRGGTQACLIEADDGRFYVVKFSNNPQHRRVLVNEMVASVLLRYLQISTPSCAIVRITSEFLGSNPDLSIQFGHETVRVQEGRHYGSLYPGDPDRNAVYDFIPDILLETVTNLAEFLGVLVFDKWAGNLDWRQAIFFRARPHKWLASPDCHPLTVRFLALMIDQGYAFGGPKWRFFDCPTEGIYISKQVYKQVVGWDSFQPWLDRIIELPSSLLDEAYRQVPREWIDGDAVALERLLEDLYRRRRGVPDLLQACKASQPGLFPEWCNSSSGYRSSPRQRVVPILSAAGKRRARDITVAQGKSHDALRRGHPREPMARATPSSLTEDRPSGLSDPEESGAIKKPPASINVNVGRRYTAVLARRPIESP